MVVHISQTLTEIYSDLEKLIISPSPPPHDDVDNKSCIYSLTPPVSPRPGNKAS